MEESKSLNWLRHSVRYVIEIIAALSFLLLTIGLVSASWNFLDKDQIFGNAPLLQSLWGLDQALAIDANLPLTFVVLYTAIKHKDWGIVAIYAIIGAMLLFVAAVILGTESLRQALNVTLEQAAQEIHIPIELLTLIRSAATIGLVAMSGLNLSMIRVQSKEASAPIAQPSSETSPAPEPEPVPQPKPETSPKGPTGTKAISNGHTPKEDTYQRYLELATANPNATAPWLAKELGCSTSTISNYRRKSKSKKANNEHDELALLVPGSPEEAYAS